MGGRFEGKAVLVTGGGTGIGRATALAFGQQGAQVAVCGRRTAPLADVVAELGERGLAVGADVAQPGESARVVASVMAAFGRLDVLVNNAGVMARELLEDSSDEAIAKIYGVNVLGLMSMTREAITALRASKGCVVNVGSTVARIAKPGLSAYSSSKAAVEQVTRSLATELGPDGIRVNAVAPGMTETDMMSGLRSDPGLVEKYVEATPLRRAGTPEDITPPIVFLASEDARWITGQVLQVSGGFQL